MHGDTKSASIWAVQLLGHKFDLMDWKESLSNNFDPYVIESTLGEERLTALQSPRFDSLTNCDSVREVAEPLIKLINGAMRLERGCEPVSLGHVLELNNDGSVKTAYASMRANLRARSHLSATLNMASASEARPPPKPSLSQQLVASCDSSEKLSELLTTLGRAYDWYEVYKVIEISGALVGGYHKLLEALATDADAVDDAKRTANYYRHAKSIGKYSPPANPTNLKRAQDLAMLAARKAVPRTE